MEAQAGGPWRMIATARSVSSATNRANSPVVIGIGSAPWLVHHRVSSVDAIASERSFPRVRTISAGVPARTHAPYQIGKSKPSMPCSAMVGASGSQGERWAVLTPRARSVFASR